MARARGGRAVPEALGRLRGNERRLAGPRQEPRDHGWNTTAPRTATSRSTASSTWVRRKRRVTIGLAFGDRLHHATSMLYQSLGVAFSHHRERFIDQWHRACGKIARLGKHSHDGGRLYQRSHSLPHRARGQDIPGRLHRLAQHPVGRGQGRRGARRLSPRLDARPRQQRHGAARDRRRVDSAPRAHLPRVPPARRRRLSPELLDRRRARTGGASSSTRCRSRSSSRARLHEPRALHDFDPYALVLGAAGYPGPPWSGDAAGALGGERGLLALDAREQHCRAHLRRRLCPRAWRREHGASSSRTTPTFSKRTSSPGPYDQAGTLVPGITRHFVRMLPVDVNDPHATEDVDGAILNIEEPSTWSARLISGARDRRRRASSSSCDTGCARPLDPLVEDSLRVVDAVLKVETPSGPCWRRYNHDGYGQREDGGPFRDYGRGRAWPLLTGERAHYELAAGRDTNVYVHALEASRHTVACFQNRYGTSPTGPRSAYAGRRDRRSQAASLGPRRVREASPLAS